VDQSFTWSGGGYTLAWEIDPPPPPPTPEEIAAAAALAAQQLADAEALAAAKADATIQYMVTHTPLECYQKVQTDVTDLASAKVMLGRLAMAISVIARDKLR